MKFTKETKTLTIIKESSIIYRYLNEGESLYRTPKLELE